MTDKANTAASNITHRRVLHLALPVVLSNATIPILGAVDTGVVGQMGDPIPIGAVGIGAIILTAIYWIFGFLRMGVVGLTAQAIGAKDTQETAALLSRALLIGVSAGSVLILSQAGLFSAAFRVSPASPEVETLARRYMTIRIWSAPAAIALYGIIGWLIAHERGDAVLIVQLWMNGINIALDFLFVLEFGWGVSGVAWATFLAEWSGLALGLWLCRRAFAGQAWRTGSIVFQRAKILRLATVSGDIVIRSISIEMIFVSFMFFGASQGDVKLAANQVLLQFLHITAYALDGFAFAAESLVGQAIGEKSRASLRRAAQVSSIWAFIGVILLALIFALAGAQIIDMMTTAPDVRSAARAYLPWMVAAPILGIAAWMLDGVFIGATRTADMRNMMIVSAVLYFCAVALLLPGYGNHGLWMALLFSFVIRGATLGLRYPALERACVPTA